MADPGTIGLAAIVGLLGACALLGKERTTEVRENVVVLEYENGRKEVFNIDDSSDSSKPRKDDYVELEYQATDGCVTARYYL